MQVCRGGKREEKYFFFNNSGIRDKVLTAPFLRIHIFWDVTLCRWSFTGTSKMCNIFIFKGSFETSNRKVAGSIPAGVNGFFIDIKSFRSHYGPGGRLSL